MKSVCIVTGANGFLGNNLIRLLSKDLYEIRAIYHSNSKVIDDLDCKKYQADILKPETLNEVFSVNEGQKIIVIHCASKIYLGTKYDQSVYNTNVTGTKVIVDKCLEVGARLIYISSVHTIYEKFRPIKEIYDFDQNKLTDFYAKTKTIATKYVLDMVKEKDLDAVVIQPSSILGPNNYSNDYLIQMIKMVASKKLRFYISGGYDFVDVRDVCIGIINSIKLGVTGHCYILSGHYSSVKDLLNLVSNSCKLKPIKHKIPLFLVYMALPFIKLKNLITKKDPLFSRTSIKILQEEAYFSCDKAIEEIDYHRRELSTTINDTVIWLKDNEII